jgi:hypothetical protein
VAEDRAVVVKLQFGFIVSSHRLDIDMGVFLRFEVLTAASMKMAIFWVVAPCSLVEVC